MRLRVWLMILVCCGAALAQTPVEKADSKNKGVITGRVIGEDGQPLAGASVQAQSRTGVSRNVFTAEDGSFRLTGLSASNYRLSASLPAYVMSPMTGEAGEPRFFRDGDSATITLVKGGVLTGRVTDANGQPIPGLQISAQRLRNAEGKLLNNFGYARRTDDRGIYRIFGLPSGTYVVRSEGSDSGWSWNADEQANDSTIYYPSSSRDAATELSVQPGVELSGIDINYRAEPGRKVSGKVFGATNGQYFMTYLRLPGSGETMHENFRSVAGSKLEDGIGFELRGIADGEYELSAERTNGEDDGAVSPPRRVSVKGSDVTGVDLRLMPLASITGKVLFEDLPKPVTAKDSACSKLRGGKIEESVVTASAEQTPAQLQQHAQLGYSAVTAEGNFKIIRLFAARYRFSLQLPSEAWYVRSIVQPDSRSQRKLSLADGLTIKSGDKIKDVTVTLANGAATLSGKLKTDAGKKPPANLRIHLIPAEKESAEDALRYFESKAAENGAFAFHHLPPGKYWLLTRASEEASITDATKRSKLRREAEAVNTMIE
ncbi:MAG: carboxypeptidase regulatory-like domain-containing protein, partial [Blastocatellia bacterium]